MLLACTNNNFLKIGNGPQDTCGDLPLGVTLDKRDIEVAGAKLADFSLGNFQINSTPEFQKVISEAASNETVREVLDCKTVTLAVLGKDAETVAYFMRLRIFPASNPSPELHLKWQQANPFPRTSVADPAGLRFLKWSTLENASCEAIIDASHIPSRFRDGYDLALVCGFHDSSVDNLKETRISISSLFAPQDRITIVVPYSEKMRAGIRQAAVETATREHPPEGATYMHATYDIWFRPILLPRGTDLTNIHQLNDVISVGGEISSAYGATTQTMTTRLGVKP